MLTLSDDPGHSIDLNWACQMKKFFNVLNKTEIWLRQDPEEIRGNIKSLTEELADYYYILRKTTTEWLTPPLSLVIDQ